ncbi:MAG: response regulator, partial [Bacillota bacterium]
MASFLIIDDNMLMRKNIKSIVESLGHKVVGELKNGIDIINKYQEFQPDVISLDIVMPQTNGLQVLKKIKSNYPETKVIMVTCLGKKNEILEALKLGADYYIEKPIESEDLVEALNKVLEGENLTREIVEQIKIDSDFKQERKWLKEEVKRRLKRELENLEREDSDNLEKQLDDLALGLDEMNS